MDCQRSLADLHARSGPRARTGPAATAQGIGQSLQFNREHELDRLCFRGWRLDDGWLSAQGQAMALELFHDRLAVAMRKQVVALLAGWSISRSIAFTLKRVKRDMFRVSGGHVMGAKTLMCG